MHVIILARGSHRAFEQYFPVKVNIMTARNNDTVPLSNRISILMDELMLAIKWDRPCISLAVYQSEYIREDVQSIVKQSLLNQGNAVQNYEVDKAHYDIALDLRDHPGRKQTVFFISGLRWGGGKGHSNAYHALNMHREYLVEERIRSVFWLTKNEARLLPRNAPDFWAFRYNVIEFFDFPSGVVNKSPDPLHKGHGQTVETIHAQLDRNPHDARLQKRIAGLYKKMGCYEDALTHYHSALRINPKEKGLWFEIANIYIKMKQPDSADRILRKVAKMAGNDPETLKKLGQLSLAVQRL